MPDELFADVPPSNDLNTAVQLSDPREQRNLLIIQDLEHDLPYRQIADMHGVSLGLIAKIAKDWHAMQGVTRKLMAAGSLGALDDWRTARAEAAKKGDHRPAKDWLLHAQEIDPIADTGTGRSGVTIIIGDGHTPAGHTPAFPSLQVIDTQALTYKLDE